MENCTRRLQNFGKSFETALKAIWLQSVEAVTKIAQVLEVQLAESLKRLESDFRLEGVKFSNKMKRVLNYCNVIACRKGANCVAMLSNRFADARKIDSNDASASDTLLDREAVTYRSKDANEGYEEMPAVYVRLLCCCRSAVLQCLYCPFLCRQRHSYFFVVNGLHHLD